MKLADTSPGDLLYHSNESRWVRILAHDVVYAPCLSADTLAEHGFRFGIGNGRDDDHPIGSVAMPYGGKARATLVALSHSLDNRYQWHPAWLGSGRNLIPLADLEARWDRGQWLRNLPSRDERLGEIEHVVRIGPKIGVADGVRPFTTTSTSMFDGHVSIVHDGGGVRGTDNGAVIAESDAPWWQDHEAADPTYAYLIRFPDGTVYRAAARFVEPDPYGITLDMWRTDRAAKATRDVRTVLADALKRAIPGGAAKVTVSTDTATVPLAVIEALLLGQLPEADVAAALDALAEIADHAPRLSRFGAVVLA